VLVALGLGGGGWLWVKGEHEARQAQLARDVNEALNQAAALREQAKAAPQGGAALFAQAREQGQRALALVESGPAEPALRGRVEDLQAELDEEEKDRQLIAALEAARLAQAETLSENRFANERAVPLFREAFRAYGLPAGEGDLKAAAARIRQRPAAVREAIAAALDEWDDLTGEPKLRITEPHRAWLRAVLAAAEPEDAWGRQVRAARAEPDKAKKKAPLEKLAASADVAKVPARALTQLAKQLDPAPQVALLRRAQSQYPADFWVNHNLGMALQRVTPPEPKEAVRFLTAAAALRPESPGCLLNLGAALRAKGQGDDAIACCRKAIELDPKNAAAHTNLGAGLANKGQLDEAIACWRQAVQLDPKAVMARVNLAKAEPLAARMALVRDRLPAFRNGSYTPASNEERLALAEWCRIKKLPHTAAGLYTVAFAADPKLADDLAAEHRLDAARNAALAAAGQGEDASTLDDRERTRLRKQSLGWLRADLDLWTRQLQSGQPADRGRIQEKLRRWQQDKDLAGIRDAAALAELPAEERKALAQLWADVAALRKKAETPPP
jgi:tetratricopeptide (TPR) repeat protein